MKRNPPTVAWLLGLAFLSLTLFSESVTPTGSQEIVSVQELRLVDANGRLLAVLSGTAEGGASLSFFDEKQARVLEIGHLLSLTEVVKDKDAFSSLTGLFAVRSDVGQSEDKLFEGEIFIAGVDDGIGLLDLSSQHFVDDRLTGSNLRLLAGSDSGITLSNKDEKGWQGVELGTLSEKSDYGISVHSDLSMVRLLNSPPSLSLFRGESRNRVLRLEYAERPQFRWSNKSAPEQTHPLFPE